MESLFKQQRDVEADADVRRVALRECAGEPLNRRFHENDADHDAKTFPPFSFLGNHVVGDAELGSKH